MAYNKQNFEDNKTVLTANMLSLMEDGIIDNDVTKALLDNNSLDAGTYNVFFLKRNGKVAPIYEKVQTTSNYYFYDAIEDGIFSPNNVYKRTPLYSQGGQDGTIYKGLSFRGNGGGVVAIRNVDTGASIGSMNWEKSNLLKPHDNSVSLNVEYSNEKQAINIDWTLNYTYSASNGAVTTGSRAISPKLSLKEYSNISISVSSCKFIVCCYDSKNNYLGQISPDFSKLEIGSGQWHNANTIITEEMLLSLNNNIDNIGICVYDNVIPTYDVSWSSEICYMYSNIYNSYASGATPEEKHIGECCVYEVWEENSIWNNSLKQLIKIGFYNDPNYWAPSSEARPYGNFAVDAENKYLYAFTMYSGKNSTYWYKFNLPSVTDGDWNETYGCYVCTLTVDDIVDSWTTPLQNYVQGACVHNNIIYTTEGFNGATGTNVARMRLIDPTIKEQIAVFHFFSDDDPVEPEFIDFYGNKCYYGSVQHMYTLEYL